MQHGFATVGDEREEREGDERHEQVFAMEVIGVENGDNEDSDKVVDDC